MYIFDTFQGLHFTWKPGKTWKNLEFASLGQKKTVKTWNIRNLEKKRATHGILNKNY